MYRGLCESLRRLGLPGWAVRAFLAVTRGRMVRFAHGAFRGPLRRLLRSVGMGGPASPLLWSLAYDPILAACVNLTGRSCPTYVDDLAALLESGAQTLRLSILLPWASWAAGLRVATHTCRGLELDTPP